MGKLEAQSGEPVADVWSWPSIAEGAESSLCLERLLALQIFLSRCDTCLEACEIPFNFLSC